MSTDEPEREHPAQDVDERLGVEQRRERDGVDEHAREDRCPACPIDSTERITPTTRPSTAGGLRVCTVVMIPTDSALPGMPDNANSRMYTHSASLRCGAFQNTNDTAPIPMKPATIRCSGSMRSPAVRSMPAEHGTEAIVPRMMPTSVPSRPSRSTTNTTNSTTKPPCAICEMPPIATTPAQHRSAIDLLQPGADRMRIIGLAVGVGDGIGVGTHEGDRERDGEEADEVDEHHARRPDTATSRPPSGAPTSRARLVLAASAALAEVSCSRARPAG